MHVLALWPFRRQYRSMKKILAALCLWLAWPSACLAWSGTVLSVHDGETLAVAPCGDEDTPVVCLYGLDALEDDQPGGGPSAALGVASSVQ